MIALARRSAVRVCANGQSVHIGLVTTEAGLSTQHRILGVGGKTYLFTLGQFHIGIVGQYRD
jgi:hypothetical protein